MNTRKVTAWGIILLASQCIDGYAFADASYQSSTQITGGTLVDTLKSVSFLSKSMSNMFAPTTTLTMVHGNQKATVSKESTEIIDLDKEEMIHIDNVKKTYSVVTFAQMRQAFQNMPQKMQQMQTQVKQAQAQQPQQPTTNLKTSYNVEVKNTGVSKVVNGLMAQEQLITMTMTITDPDAAAAAAASTPGSAPSGPNSMTYTVTTDAWIAPDPPEVKEIHDFDMRMGQKMMQGVDMQAWAASMRNVNPGMAQMLGSKPGASDAMAQMAKEMAKLKGTRVLEVTSMGGLAPAGATQPSGATPAAAPANSGNSVAGQVATDTATQTAAGEASRLGTLGSALGSSALSAWHRKKASTPPPPTTSTAAPAATPANGSGQASQNVVLMSSTTQQTNFSTETVPSSAFEVPNGFAKVPSAYDKLSK